MKVAPVKKYIEPRYPTSQILEEHPELLKIIPKRWQGNTMVLTTLAGLCILSSCLQKESAAKQAPGTTPASQQGKKRARLMGLPAIPPVFLSEDEAREVIVDEAKRAGITFKADGHEFIESNTPELKPYLPLVFDGYDEKYKISYEVVSMSDFKNWNTIKIQPAIQSSYDTKEMAKRLKDALVKAKSGGYYVVFYSPGEYREAAKKHYGYKQPAYDAKDVDWQAENAKILEMTKDLAREDLRNQVKDFISWLKAEGVI
ncbi:MAG: hypothetical protein ABFD64_01155 [Armatimonadota bacterium]